MQTLFPYIKKLDPNNYRPIFLLSNISQLYEKTMGCSIFYPYKGMDDQISKNQYILQRTIVWLINPLELNLRWFDPSEKNDITEKFFHSPTLKKVTVQIYPQEKYIYLETEIPWKNHNQETPKIFTSIPLYRKWNSPMHIWLTFSEKIKYCFPINSVFEIIVQLIMLLEASQKW